MTVAILFGGQSYEHEISIVSAIALKKVLTCNIIYIFCDKDREFYLIPTGEITSKRFSSGAYKKDTKLLLKQGGFYTKSMLKDKPVLFDVAINLIHGADGEDGKIAALFDFFNVPYIGPRLEGSVLSYSKLWNKYLAQEMGVKTLEFEVVNKNNRQVSLPLPIIIKPLRLGSSIGLSVVKEASELEYALDVAFEFDDDVLIEPFIQGVKEYNLAGCKTNDGFEYSLIEEPQKEDILDFDKKYLDFSRTQRVFEAALDEATSFAMKQAFAKLYDPLFVGALIRCDFFVIDDDVYLNEINPNPGSMANYLFEDFDGVIGRLAKALPKNRHIAVQYQYINSIQAAKGKA